MRETQCKPGRIVACYKPSKMACSSAWHLPVEVRQLTAPPASMSLSHPPKAVPEWALHIRSHNNLHNNVCLPRSPPQSSSHRRNADSTLFSPPTSQGLGHRWNNVLSDSSRQMVIELFLGLRLAQHLPSLHQRLHYPPPGPPEDPESDADEPYEKESLHAARQVPRPSPCCPARD